MCEHGFAELNGNNCIMSLPMFVFGYWSAVSLSPVWGLLWGTFALSTAYCVFGTNQFHSWSHTPNPPALVKLLQKYHIILNVEHHDDHHRFPHNTNYGITNGISDDRRQRKSGDTEYRRH